MSDIHGRADLMLDALDKCKFNPAGGDMLILCGDYIDHGWMDYSAYYNIMELKSNWPDNVIVLLGNHEDSWLETYEHTNENPTVAKWLREVGKLYYETEHAIYVHAGVNEEADDLWHLGTPDETFMYKYPPELGDRFYKDIVAGHVWVNNEFLRGDKTAWSGVFHDMGIHYYIDGCCEQTGIIPVLIYNTKTKEYTTFDKDGTECVVVSEW